MQEEKSIMENELSARNLHKLYGNRLTLMLQTCTILLKTLQKCNSMKIQFSASDTKQQVMKNKELEQSYTNQGSTSNICPTLEQGPSLQSELQILQNLQMLLPKDVKLEDMICLLSRTNQVHDSLKQFINNIYCQQCTSRRVQVLFEHLERLLLQQEEQIYNMVKGYCPAANKVALFKPGHVLRFDQIKTTIHKIHSACQAYWSSINDGINMKQASADQADANVSEQLQKLPQCDNSQCPTRQLTFILQQQLQMLVEYYSNAQNNQEQFNHQSRVLYFSSYFEQIIQKWRQYTEQPKCCTCNAFNCSFSRSIAEIRFKSCTYVFQNYCTKHPDQIIPRLCSNINWLKRLSKWCKNGQESACSQVKYCG